MNVYYREIKVLWIIALLFTHLAAMAQKDVNTKAYQKKGRGLEIPLDPKVKKGVLPNGFEYYILKNAEPKDRMVMYLANKVGSILETDRQQGLAHFLEHMNFNGTTHFPKNELVDYLQRSGIRFGADLNAYTGFDETVYQLPLPSNDPELLKQGLIIMRDWAHGALLEDDEIDQERGVILEEKRQRGGLSSRLQEKTFPMLTNNSRYANRLPIGTEEILKNFKYSEIREFYKDWYRPELQALIIVGDIDEVAIEKEVIRLFSDLKNPSKAPKRNYYTITLTGKNQFLTFTDEEITSTSLQISYKVPAFRVMKSTDYKIALERGLFTQLLNARLGELTRKASTPFLSAGFGSSELLGGLETNSISITPKPGKLKESIYAVYEAFEQVRQYGFTDNELQRAKTNYRTSLERSKAEESKKRSQSYMEEILAYYLKDQPAPGFDYIFPILLKNIETVSLQDIQRHAVMYTDTKNRDMVLTAPENKAKELPNEKQLLAWIDDATKVQPQSYQEDIVGEDLVVDLPAPAKIVDRRQNEGVGSRTILLDNGVKVVMKPTDFMNDEIQITSFSPGGYSLYNLEDFQSAVNATSIVGSSGLGPFDALQLSRYLNGKSVSVSPYINEIGEGIKASTVQKDVKTAFELIHAFFYQTRLDRELIEANLEKSKIGLENRLNNVGTFFSDSITRVLYNNDPRKTGPSEEKIKQINLDRALEIFKDRFADASDFTFVIVGNFNLDEMEQYAAQYLGTLPNLGRKEQFVDNASYPPAKGFDLDIRKGKEEKATVAMAYLGDFNYSDRNSMLMEALSSCINVKLLQRLREKESGVYSINVSPSVSKIPRERFGLNISFTTDPQLVAKLTEAAVDEIEKIRKDGPDQVDVDKFIAEKLLSNQQALVQNGFWLSYLLSTEIDQKDPLRVFSADERLKSITKKELQQLADQYLSAERLFKFVLYPEVP
ncbi:M16 family metallopeptidase [Sphingobacterium tabacisoli]|uniref:M16 family metallopeptidase n=1 Tax=Sphingobacterium tabacisoli TaxID=2044855 RepID=A0ABW5L082_9SPHI|nr:insulinase family protein [Sphingobacterium tabacisoli]